MTELTHCPQCHAALQYIECSHCGFDTSATDATPTNMRGNDTMTDTQRQAFEAEMEKQGRIRPFLRDPEGEHTDSRMWWAWIGFQAAQAALSGAAQEGWLQVEIRPIVMAGSPNACQVWLKRGTQQFAVGNPHETREDGEWFADMLRKAIAPAAPAVAPPQQEIDDRFIAQYGYKLATLLGIDAYDLADRDAQIKAMLAAPAQAEQQGDGGALSEFELTPGEIQACSIEPAILRMLAGTHEEIAETADTMDAESRAAYHATRASELKAQADNQEREMRERDGGAELDERAAFEQGLQEFVHPDQPSAPLALSEDQIEEILDSMSTEIGCELSDCEIAQINGHEVVMVRKRTDRGSQALLFVDKCERTYEDARAMLAASAAQGEQHAD